MDLTVIDSRWIHRGGARNGVIAFACFGTRDWNLDVTGPVSVPVWAPAHFQPASRPVPADAAVGAGCAVCGDADGLEVCIQCDRELLCTRPGYCLQTRPGGCWAIVPLRVAAQVM